MRLNIISERVLRPKIVKASLDDLQQLCVFLREGLHKSAFKSAGKLFPHGVYVLKDREILYSRSYRPLWQCFYDTGLVEVADTNEWLDEAEQVPFFYTPHKDLVYRDYAGMNELKARLREQWHCLPWFNLGRHQRRMKWKRRAARLRELRRLEASR